jgi:hypothetical protein
MVFMNIIEVGVLFFVTVSSILPHFGMDRVGLSAKENIVVSSFSVFGVEEWA